MAREGNITLSPAVQSALGESVISEEMKGDFAKAAEVATHLVTTAGGSDDPEAIDARLDLALVHIIQGLACSAIEGLDQLPPPDVLAPDQHARSVALRKLAVYLRFNTFPGGEGAGGAHLETVWRGHAYAAEEQTRWQAVPLAACNRAVALEAHLLHDTLCNLKSARTFVVPGPWMSEKMREENFRIALQVVATLLEIRTDQTDDPVGAFALFAGADLCRRAHLPDAMQSFIDQARTRYEGLGDWAGVAICWILLGDVLAAPFTTPLYDNLPLEDTRDLSSAISQELRDAARAATDPRVQAAREAYKMARRLFSKASAPRGLASIDLREAYLCALASDSDAAVAAARGAAEAFTAAGDHLYARLATVHELLHRIDRSPFECDTTTVREIGEWGRDKGSVSWTLGLGLLLTAKGQHWIQEQGDGDRAIACYRLAQALYEALGAEVNVAQSLVDRAEVHKLSGEMDACLSLYQQASNIYLDCRDRLLAIRSDLALRLVRLQEAMYWLHAGAVDAEGMARDADRLCEAIDEQTANDPGAGQGDNARPDAADVVLVQARSTLRQAAVMIPLYRAKTLAEQGLAEKAQSFFKQALQEVGELNGPDKDWLEALVRGTMRDFAGAGKALERRFEGGDPAADDTVATALRVVGTSSSAAARQMEGRLEIEAHLNAFYFLVQVEAFEAASRHLRLVEDCLGPDWWQSETRPWESLVRRADLWAGLKDDKGALADVDRCIELLEKTRIRLLRDTQRTALTGSSVARHVFTLGIRSAYRLMQTDHHASWHWLECTYRYAEAGKARALLDLLCAVELGSVGTQLPSWVHRWRELNARLTTLQALAVEEQSRKTSNAARLQELQAKEREVEAGLQTFITAIAPHHPRLKTLLEGRSDVSSTDEVVEHLPNGSLLLQYHFADNEFFGWAMDSSGRVEVHRASHDARKIRREIQEFHTACSTGRDWVTTGQRLAQIFLAPFAKRLEGVEQVVVVPFGAAHRLPFHALPWSGGVFCETHSISIAPSGSVVCRLQRLDRAEAGSILAVGNPVNMALPSELGERGRTLGALPASALEAGYLASLDEGNLALVGKDATLDKIRTMIRRFRFLHFATHGVLNERAPLSSAILLANGEALSAADLLGLELNADLVVLSGCRTGLGEVTAGDEVVGLTRALLASGAKAAVVSLWPVRDAATSYFMRYFYNQLAAVGPAEALKRAQAFLRTMTPQQREHQRDTLIHTLEYGPLSAPLFKDQGVRDIAAAEAMPPSLGYSHPYYWAPFIYVGAP